VATIATALLIISYMVSGWNQWLQKVMQLTYMAGDFKLFIMVLGLLYLGLAWTGENLVFQRLARLIGHAKLALTQRQKTRKQYKVILEQMLF
jgi:cation-transporting ATPase 13A2